MFTHCASEEAVAVGGTGSLLSEQEGANALTPSGFGPIFWNPSATEGRTLAASRHPYLHPWYAAVLQDLFRPAV